MIQVESNPTLLPPFQPVQALDLQLGNEYVLQVTANSRYAMASCSDSTVRLYDLATLQPATALRQQKVLTKMQLYNDSTLFTSSVDGTLVRWDLRTAQPVQTLTCKQAQAFVILVLLIKND